MYILKELALLVLLFTITLDTYAVEQHELDSLKALLKKEEKPHQQIKLLLELSDKSLNINLTESLSYIKSAEAIVHKHRNDSLNAKINFQYACVYFQEGEYVAAQRYYHRFYTYSLETKNDRFLFHVLANLGSVAQVMQEYDKALNDYEESYAALMRLKREFKPKDFTEKRIQLLNNIGNVYNSKGTPEKAYSNYKKALALAEKIESKEALGYLCRNIGEYFLAKNILDSAYTYLERSYQERISDRNEYGLSSSCLSLGKYYLAKHQQAKAIDMLQMAKSYATKSGSKSSEMDAEYLLYMTFKQAGDTRQALSAFERYKTLNDTINNLSYTREIIKVQHQMDLERKEAEMQASQKRRDTYFFAGFIVLSLIVIVFALLFFLIRVRYQWLRLESKANDLEKANLDLEIESKNRELATNVLYMSQKNELISEVITRIQELKRDFNGVQQERFNEIISELEEIQNTGSWEEFEVLFKRVNGRFYDILSQRYPDLSANERRLCAFMRLNMSTKEIIGITNQSARAIDMARHRLRKKLAISNSGISLSSFLNELDKMP